ncbi:hypothetical protein PAMP_019254 [Pampus punctatissimus]
MSSRGERRQRQRRAGAGHASAPPPYPQSLVSLWRDAGLFAAVSGVGALFCWSESEQREIKRFPLYCVFTASSICRVFGD